MAKNRGFNGTTVAFGAESIGLLRSCNLTQGGAEVDVGATVGADGTTAETSRKYEAGIADRELTVEVVGSTPKTGGASPAAIAYGAKQTLVITWNDNESDDLGTCVVTQIDPGGERDGELVSSITFRPADADLA